MLTLKELLDQLHALVVTHGEKILDEVVWCEGCDCDGEAGSVTYAPSEQGPGVHINRYRSP